MSAPATTTTSVPSTGPNPLPSSSSDQSNNNARGGRGRGGGGAGAGGPRGRFVRGGPARGSFRPAGPANVGGDRGGNGNGDGRGGDASEGPRPGDGAYLLNRGVNNGGMENDSGRTGGGEFGGRARGGSRNRGGRGGALNPNASSVSSGPDQMQDAGERPDVDGAKSRRTHPRSRKKGPALDGTSTPSGPNTNSQQGGRGQVQSTGVGQNNDISRTSSRSPIAADGGGTLNAGSGKQPGGRSRNGNGGSTSSAPTQARSNTLRPDTAAFVPFGPENDGVNGNGNGNGNGALDAASPVFQPMAITGILDGLVNGYDARPQSQSHTRQYQGQQLQGNQHGHDQPQHAQPARSVNHSRSQSRSRAVPPHMSSQPDNSSNNAAPHHPQNVPPPKPKGSRKAAFGGKLTSDVDAFGQSPDMINSEDEAQERAASGIVLNGGMRNGHTRGQSKVGLEEVARVENVVEEEKDDVTSRLTRGLSRKPYLECPICFASLLPSQSIWSCLPTSSSTESSSTPSMLCCYTPFHLSCIMDWSSRSLSESREKIRNSDRPAGVPLDDATWRCPGCQKKRGEEVRRYECFCGAVKNLKTGGAAHSADAGRSNTLGPGGASIVAPHTCGNQCRRKRTYCSHPCPLPCHAGPCPACIEQLVIPCPSHGTALAVKCSLAKGWDIAAPVCTEQCAKSLLCGNPDHRCAETCHEGSCPPCDHLETALCYCGAEEKEVPCGWNKGDGVECARDMGEEIVGEDETLRWTGRFQCHRSCQRLYDCGIHSCEEGHCHPHPVQTLICPSSPALVTHCACGQTQLDQLDVPIRTKCTDPIPTCDMTCPRPLSGCDHPCGKCHTGPCPPCMVPDIAVPCRCGESITKMVCSERKKLEEKNGGEGIFLCERICKAQRNCLHHECGIRCCPLAYQAKSKGKRREILDSILDDETSIHHCTLPCGKLLSCGVHPCPAEDHRGPCGRCLEASYEELICACGHTKLDPPIRCGTAMPDCSYPCHRPPPACGHPKVPHTCHEDALECPGCPYLITKACQCGKATVKNVRCSSNTVSCGSICGRKLSCGGHLCKRTCHDLSAGCETCTQVCGKNKRICGHPDQAVCHAPSACDEEAACAAIVTLTCPCGNQQQRASCGASVSNRVSREKTSLKCTSECLLRQRNSRLAEALGITPSEKVVEYPEALKSFTLINHAFVVTVEKAFSDFFLGPKQYHVLPHMPPVKRDFVMGLAGIYRFQTELVDADPQRSVAIRRRIDSRIPHPNISTVVVLAPPKRFLGGLVDLKKTTTLSSAPIRPSVSSPAPRAWSQPSTPRAFASLAATPIASAASSLRPSPATSPRLQHDRPRVTPSSGSHWSAYVPPHQRSPQGDDLSAPDWEDADV